MSYENVCDMTVLITALLSECLIEENSIIILEATFKELLSKDYFVTLYHKNQQLLTTEIFNVKNNLPPDIMKVVFQFKNSTYNPCSCKIRTTYHKPNSIQYLATKMWEKKSTTRIRKYQKI